MGFVCTSSGFIRVAERASEHLRNRGVRLTSRFFSRADQAIPSSSTVFDVRNLLIGLAIPR